MLKKLNKNITTERTPQSVQTHLPEGCQDEKKSQEAPCFKDALAHDPHEEVVDNVGSEQEPVDPAAVLLAEGQRRYCGLRGERACNSSSNQGKHSWNYRVTRKGDTNYKG